MLFTAELLRDFMTAYDPLEFACDKIARQVA